MENDTTIQQLISASILRLRMRSPFFAALALFARIRLDPHIPTAQTDGRDIIINEKFWKKMTVDEQLGVFLHEILHVALLHVPRIGTRDALLWNIAADIVVNGIITTQSKIALPKGHIRDPKLEHLSVEEIYSIFQKNGKKETLKKYKIPWVDLVDAGNLTPDERKALEQYWHHSWQRATTAVESSGQGTLPVGMQRELGQIQPAQLDWRTYLWRFIVQTPVDFQGFDRRFIGQGLYLETLTGETVQVYIAVDTSGSIGRDDINQFLGEVRGILDAYPHLRAQLYYVDAACYGPYEIKPELEIPAPVGGGGTDFRPFFDTVEKEKQTSVDGVYVYLTDGYGTFPAEPPSLPVLWVLSSGGLDLNAIPFGEAVRLLQDH